MTTRKPTVEVVPGQIWADTAWQQKGRTITIEAVVGGEEDGTRDACTRVLTDADGPYVIRSSVGRRSRVRIGSRGLRGYTLVPDPDEQGTVATLTGSIAIEPAAVRDDLDRVPETSYVHVNRDGTAIVPSDNAPLSTESVAREVRALMEALRGFEFNGALIRTAAAKYGSGRSRIDVTDSVVRF